MNGYFTQAGVFLISVVFGFYILLVMVRFLLQAVRADFYNPLSQFVVRLTTPPLRPLRRIIPGVAGIDVAALVLLLLLQVLELVLVHSITGRTLHPGVLLVLAVAQLISTALLIFIVAIIIQAILSWVQPGAHNPFTMVLYQLTTPVLRPFRRVVPPVSGIDLSPMVALLALYLLLMAVPYLQAMALTPLRP